MLGRFRLFANYGKLSAVECSAEIGQVFTTLIAQAIDALSLHTAVNPSASDHDPHNADS